jgi:hypothetical protein
VWVEGGEIAEETGDRGREVIESVKFLTFVGVVAKATAVQWIFTEVPFFTDGWVVWEMIVVGRCGRG